MRSLSVQLPQSPPDLLKDRIAHGRLLIEELPEPSMVQHQELGRRLSDSRGRPRTAIHEGDLSKEVTVA